MSDMTAEERARLLLDKHFVRDEIAGYIPLHYNQLRKDLPEEIREAEAAAYRDGEEEGYSRGYEAAVMEGAARKAALEEALSVVTRSCGCAADIEALIESEKP